MGSADILSRRQFLRGQIGKPEGDVTTHVSSAVIRAVPARIPDLMPQIAALPGVEVVASQNGRVVLVMEAASSGELGERLTAINLMDGVIAASMVFEQSAAEEELRAVAEELRDDNGTDAP